MAATTKQAAYLTDLIQAERNQRRCWSKLTAAQSAALLADMQTRVMAEIEAGMDGQRASELIDAAQSLSVAPKSMLVALRYTREQIVAAIAQPQA